MVNIETPSVPESPAILREILQNKVPISHEFLLTKSKMQATPADLITERENSSPKHVTRSDQDSEIGSDAESSFLDQSRVDETEVDEAKSDMDDNQSNAVTSGEENRDLMRARADKIESGHPHHYGDMEAMYGLNEVRRQKRKQSLPQQYEQDAKFRRLDGHPFEDDLWALRQQMSVVQNYFRHFDEGIPKPMNGYAGMENIHHLHQAYFANLQAARHAEVLQKEQQQNAQAKAVLGAFEKRVAIERDHYNIAEHVRETVNAKKGLSKGVSELNERELNELVSCLKSKIEEAVSATVDSELSRFFDKRNKQKETGSGNFHSKEPLRNGELKPELEKEKKTTDHSLNHILQLPDSKVNINNNSLFRLPERHSAFEPPKLSGNGIQDIQRLPFPHHPPLGYPPISFYLPTSLHPPSIYSCPIIPPEQTEALSLVVNTPKKKRTKVTDTRLSPRAARALLQENGSLSAVYDHERVLSASYGHINPPCLPTSVAIPNPSLQQSDLLNFYKEQRMCGSPGDLDRATPCSSPSDGGYSFMNFNDSDSFDSHGKQTTDTLTPMHLRKAKLMFFYVRYPSSAILKVYFPDVQFNKNNTAQLVKWFSNFREFYYIQMEKYARQAIAEGCKRSEDLVVTTDSELYRVLNLHYNRNNQIEVPENYRLTVQSTLREFYQALVANKDQEPSWKKPIYKVIARMDDALPEFFKASNWMDQLGDA